MDQLFLVLLGLLLFLNGSMSMLWRAQLCYNDAHCPTNQCCNRVHPSTGVHLPTGECVNKGLCDRHCHSDADCLDHECCKITHAGANHGTCSHKITYRARCLVKSNMLAPAGQHFTCPCDRGLSCVGTGLVTSFGETGICKDSAHPARCVHDDQCPRRRCCRYGHCVIPFGGARRNRCGTFRGRR